MSTQIKEVLKSILYTTGESCFLCFSSLNEDGIRVSDEILYNNYSETENTKRVLEMLTCVLGTEVTLNMCKDDQICQNCLQLCTNAYQFIEASKWNVNLMKHLIVNATTAVNQIDDPYFCNSAFLLISPSNNTAGAYLDKSQYINTKQALIGFKVVVKNANKCNNNKDYLCNRCYKGFTTLLQANEHSKTCLDSTNYSSAGAESPIHSETEIKELLKSEIEEEEPCIYIAPSNFECKICFAEFKKFSKLQEHSKIEHGEFVESSGLIVDSKNKMSYIVIAQDENKEIYQCSQCLSTYATYHSLQRHFMATHNKNLPKPIIRCVVCNQQCKTKSLLRQHLEVHYTIAFEDGTKVYECKLCNNTFTLYKCLTKHFELLHNWNNPKTTKPKKQAHDRLYDYGKICVICEELFKKKSLWKEHQKSHYHTLVKNNKTYYQCDLCMETFTQYTSIIRHFNRVHNNAGVAIKKSDDHGLICSTCGKVFKDKTRRRKHEESHTEKTLKCDVCNKTYRSEYSFKVHLCNPNNARVIHEKNLECDYCGRKYSKKLALQTHIRYMHLSEGLFCSVCNKRCENKRNLQDHLLVHTKEKNFQCNVCGGKFGVMAALKTHMRLHTGETPYPCEECDMQFISSSRRADHYRRHHSERTKVCDICSKKFYMPKDLKRHRARHFDRNSSLYHRRSNPMPVAVKEGGVSGDEQTHYIVRTVQAQFIRLEEY